MREMPWDALAFAVSKVIRCVPRAQFYGFTSAFMETQKTWAMATDVVAEVKKIARLGGLSGEDVDACLKNEEIHKQVNANRETGLKKVGVKGTPTLFINGKKLEGSPTFAAMKKEIEKYLQE